jgi:hypothetical protein
MDNTNINVLPLQARTANGNTSTIQAGGAELIRCQLDVTAVSGTTPTLSVTVEDTLDGVNFNTIAAFAQKTAAGREVVNITGAFSESVRVRWVVGGTSPSFTFACDWYIRTRKGN